MNKYSLHKAQFHLSSSFPIVLPDIFNPWSLNHFLEPVKSTLPFELEWSKMDKTKVKAKPQLPSSSTVPVQASTQVEPRHTPPRHSLSHHLRWSSSGSQTWVCWRSSPSPGASPSPCAPPEGTCSADKSSCKQQRLEVRRRAKKKIYFFNWLAGPQPLDPKP